MCTVSYLPLQGGGYILTSNRDEAPQRNAAEIRHVTMEGQSLIFPVDPVAGGSWFCVSDRDKVACLLNGAYVPFTPDPKFTQSRGKVLLDIMEHSSVQHFIDHSDFSRTAPFTIVLTEDGALCELIWDGSSVTLRTLDAKEPAFWSSVTLYPEEVRVWRKALFQEWISMHADFDQHEIMRFHRYGSKDDQWNGFVMNRHERVRTLSISSVKKEGRHFTLLHADLMSGETFSETVELISADVAED
ncbi:MAG TPA: NRDE family protein [Saprospiraceae bacterium]|nr:NRDE family protein [Saprospiraceae bacterium]